MLNSGGLLIAPLNSDPVSVAAASTQVVLPLSIYASTAHGRATMPITVQLQRYGRAKLPIRVTVPAQGKLTLPISLQVLPSEALAETQAWSLRLLVGGVDLSDRLVGQCRIEMEEGAARVLQVQLDGPLDIPTLSGQRVLLDFIKNGSVLRLFTGSVELPELSLVQQLVTLSCIDDRRRMLALADRETLSGWLGGHWSPSVFSSDADSLQYAEDRLSTVAGSFDLDVYGQPRLTDWQSAAQADFTVDESLIWGDSEPTIDFSRRSEMVNSVTAEFQYRYQRLRTYRHEVSWNMGISLKDYLVYEEFHSGQQYILQPRWLTPARELFTSAAESTSWHLSAAFWKAQPPSQLILVNLVGAFESVYNLAWVNNYSAADDPCCWGTKLILNHKIAQTVTETWSIKVEASDSISKFGVMSGTVSGGNLEAQFDGSSWESDFTDTESIPYAFNDWQDGAIQLQAKLKGLSAGIVDKLDVDGATRLDADEAIKTVAAVCRSKVLSTHRQTLVTWKSACMPLVDVDKTGQIDIRHLQCKGKVSRVVHLFDMATGEASTETQISLFADVAVGLVEDAPLPAPVVPVVEEVIKTTAVTIATVPEPLLNAAELRKQELQRLGFFGGVVISLKVKEVPLLDDEPRYTNSVAVTTPEIPAAETDPVDLTLAYPYQVAIPFDPVTFN